MSGDCWVLVENIQNPTDTTNILTEKELCDLEDNEYPFNVEININDIRVDLLKYCESDEELSSGNVILDDNDDAEFWKNELWIKFDETVHKRTPVRKKRINKFIKMQQKRLRLIPDLLSTNPEHSAYKERFFKPNMFVSKSVYRSCSQKIESRKIDKLTTEFVKNFDAYTLNLLERMKGYKIIDGIDGILNIEGRNSILLLAKNHSYSQENPNNLVVKIFKNFFVHYPEIKPSRWIWETSWEKPTTQNYTRGANNHVAEKEIEIIMELRCNGVHCPKPVELPPKLQRHVVVMSFIGTDKQSAKKLKDMELDLDSWLAAYQEVSVAMRIMYQQLNIMHPDLLDHILWHNGHCYFIDFRQIMDGIQYNLELDTFRRCVNLFQFFRPHLMNQPTLSANALFYFVTGFQYGRFVIDFDLHEERPIRRMLS